MDLCTVSIELKIYRRNFDYNFNLINDVTIFVCVIITLYLHDFFGLINLRNLIKLARILKLIFTYLIKRVT